LACFDGYSALTGSSMIEPLVVVAAHLVGPVAFAYIIARAKGRIDMRNVDIGNLGVGGVIRAVGSREGIVVLVADMAGGTGALAARGLSSDASKQHDLRTGTGWQGGTPQNDYL
jgi:glycerol-3-phosphate acyltransferase PlsY